MCETENSDKLQYYNIGTLNFLYILHFNNYLIMLLHIVYRRE